MIHNIYKNLQYIYIYRLMPGMYDLVSGEFYTNSGTGEFVVGADV